MKKSQQRCPICGEFALGLTQDPLVVEFRDSSYSVSGFEYERCEACGEEFFASGQVDAIQSAAVALARAEQGLLTPTQIRALRRDLGLTQSRLEQILGVGPKTVTRWEKGTVFQGRSVDRLMRLIWRNPGLVAEVESPLLAACSRSVGAEWIDAADELLPSNDVARSRQRAANNDYALAA